MKTLTKPQLKLLGDLQRGKHLKAMLGAWYHPHRGRVRETTRKALEETGELVQIIVKGHHADWSYICHETQVKKAADGLTILCQFKLGEKGERVRED